MLHFCMRYKNAESGSQDSLRWRVKVDPQSLPNYPPSALMTPAQLSLDQLLTIYNKFPYSHTNKLRFVEAHPPI